MKQIIKPDSVIDKVICGYQGWFAAESDGSPPNNWVHWSKGRPAPGNQTFELYPDISEYPEESLFDTGYSRLGNGQKAQLFSSNPKSTVNLHFQWMQQYGLDGVALQRFGGELKNPILRKARNEMAEKVMQAAERYGRIFYVMYDISGMQHDDFSSILKGDFIKTIKQELGVMDSKQYVTQNGKPVICLWGIGFTDRPGTAVQFIDLIEWFKEQGCYVIGGVPTAWRESNRDSKPNFTQVYSTLDMISPWSIGRYSTEKEVIEHKKRYLLPDIEYCKSINIDYQPVIFPGFAWSNWNGGPPNHIPRRNGKLFWSQAFHVREAENPGMYIAMFDEYDEGTAIAKAASDSLMIPADQYFLTLSADGAYISSDYYLRLAGAATRMIKKLEPISREPNIPFFSGPIYFRTGFEVGDAIPKPVQENGDHYILNEFTVSVDSTIYRSGSGSGSRSLKIDVDDVQTKSEPSSLRLFDVHIPIESETYLNYWILPVNKDSASVKIDLQLVSGRTLEDSDKVIQGTDDIKVGEWNQISINLAEYIKGDTINGLSILLHPAPITDQVLAYIDDISITGLNMIQIKK